MKVNTLVLVSLTNIAVAFVGSVPAIADCPSDWRPGEGIPGVNGVVYATTLWDPDDSGPQPVMLVVGGNFTIAGTAFANNIAAWNGAAWSPLAQGTNGTVNSLTVFNGELIAGGEFTSAGAEPAFRIARWNGINWQGLEGGSLTSGSVLSMVVFNNELIAGGTFLGVANGQAFPFIARWNGTSWNGLGSGMGTVWAPVHALTVVDGVLVAGGAFTTAGGVAAASIAKWDGQAWSAFETPFPGGIVKSLTQLNGDLYVGRAIVGPGPVLRWSGSQWNTVGTIYGTSDPGAHSLHVHNNDLYVGGRIGAPGISNIARWDGAVWQPVGGGADSGVYSIASFGGQLIVAGQFRAAGNTAASSIAAWNGSTWNTLGSGLIGAVSALGHLQGELSASGVWNYGLSTFEGYITQRSGESWSDATRISVGFVFEMAQFAGQTITAGDVGVSSWDGSQLHVLGDGVHNTALALASWDGYLIAGGLFHELTTSGAPGNYVARWDGDNWQALGSGLDWCQDGGVHSLCVYKGNIVAGGWFLTASGIAVNNIAQWDGSTWQPLGAGTNGGVYALAVHDGDLIAAGSFDTAGGVTANRIARWDGYNWWPLGSGMAGTSYPVVYALAEYNGELIAGGSFTLVGGAPANNIARWNGSSWQPLGSGISGDGEQEGYVNDLAVLNGELIVGGGFFTAGDYLSAYWARWGPACPRGDMNCDQIIDLSDVQEFVNAVLDPASLTDCKAYLANTLPDVNPDGTPRIDGNDIQPFVQCILNGCP
ncbi:MAG: hypothetical protein IT368_05095 [Candidatus Hydrogenedentes bacterium]|nr:hypothetical protein [Candidatus Hydrogenedentota bacterium]